MPRRALVAGLLVSLTVLAAFAYRVYAKQGAGWPLSEPLPGRILVADARPPQAGSAAAPAQPAGPVHVITFVDITPNNKDKGVEDCKQYVADTRKDAGNTSAELLAQTNRPNHLVIYQVWQNEAAYEKHLEAAHTKDFLNKMIPIIGAPFDERPHYVLE
jgi:quinol monooxygenase YgiN